jgi:hypothetical protein
MNYCNTILLENPPTSKEYKLPTYMYLYCLYLDILAAYSDAELPESKVVLYKVWVKLQWRRGVEIFYLVWRTFELEVPGTTQDAILTFSLENRFITHSFTQLRPRNLILILMFYNVVVLNSTRANL